MSIWVEFMEKYLKDIPYPNCVDIEVNIYGLHIIRVVNDGFIIPSEIQDELNKLKLETYTTNRNNHYIQEPGFYDAEINNYILEYPFAIKYVKDNKIYRINVLYNNCFIKHDYRYHENGLEYKNCIWASDFDLGRP